jgi:hypothetical protein
MVSGVRLEGPVKSFIVAAALFLAPMSFASAAVVTDTFTGTATGTDTDGLFGPAGAAIDESFTAVFTGDSSNLSLAPIGPVVLETVSPITGATFSLDGMTPLSFTSTDAADSFDQALFLGFLPIENGGTLGSTLNAMYGFTGMGGTFSDGGTMLDLGVTNAVFSAVPEPSAWLLSLAGFALLGAALRFKRSQSGDLTVAAT